MQLWKEETFMKTTEIEQKYGVAINTLRYFIERGLLTPTSINGSLIWNEQDEADLQTVLQLREMGLTIESIVELRHSRHEHVGLKAKLLQRMEKVREEIEAVDSELRELAFRKQTLVSALHQLGEQIIFYEESD